jgi:hypothetical protein
MEKEEGSLEEYAEPLLGYSLLAEGSEITDPVKALSFPNCGMNDDRYVKSR